MWNLTELAEGRAPRTPPRFDKLVKELAPRLEGVPDVIDPLVLRIRNAVAHNHVEYVPRARRLVLRNGDGWSMEASADEMKAVAEHVLAVGGAFTRAVHWFLLAAMVRSGVFAALCDMLVALEDDNADALKLASEACDARTRAMYDDLGRLFERGTEVSSHLRRRYEVGDAWLRGEAAPPTPHHDAPV